MEFTSNYESTEKALIASSINTVNGDASSTDADEGCTDVSGTTDQITATVFVDLTTPNGVVSQVGFAVNLELQFKGMLGIPFFLLGYYLFVPHHSALLA